MMYQTVLEVIISKNSAFGLVLSGVLFYMAGIRVGASPSGSMPVTSVHSASFAVINDNYTGNKEAGIKGNYLGADDFLTVSYLIRYHLNEYQAAVTYHTITSRKYIFRYDLLSVLAIRNFRVRKLQLYQGLGLIVKGDFSGDKIQNGWHRLKDLPEVELPYGKGGVAPQAILGGSRRLPDIFSKKSNWEVSTDLRLGWDYMPFRFRPAVSYQFVTKRVEFEMIMGAHLFMGQVIEYSEMVRPGVLGGVGCKIRGWRAFFVDLGVLFIPVDNLANDPLFQDKSRSFSPQIWSGISWNTTGKSLKEYFY